MKHGIIVTLALILSSTMVHAEEDYVNYDSIINELSQAQTRTQRSRLDTSDPFANVLIHGGVAFSSSLLTLAPAQGPRIQGFLKGFEASFGIDLFSPNWLAEGAVRSYSSEELNPKAMASLREFNLRIVHKDYFSRGVFYRMSVGLAARYLNFKHTLEGELREEKYTTPSSLVALGLETALSQTFSLGAEVAYRSALIDETIDRSAVDGTLRIDAHF